ncbi:MAG: GMC family oxidoreductase [Chloroflexota bacterium]|nr:GMC family oxidoreductase [Chloroflexota bacterium]
MRLNVNIASNWKLDGEMREYRPSDEVDVAIIGTGAGGAVLAERLARFGFSVVALEAGDWHDTESDMVSDEAGSGSLFWNDRRITGGSEPLEFGANNSGRGVGGSTVHYAAFCPRLHPSDFQTYTLDGVGVDWPIRYEELEPYYAAMEREYPVSGPTHYPWGAPHGYPYSPLEAGTAGQVLIDGCSRLGIPVVAGGPVAIPAGAVGRRPHCIMRGFCLVGCKVGAKSSTLVSHIPGAIEHGAEIRVRSMAFDLPVDQAGRVTGIRYLQTDGDGSTREAFQRAKLVIVAGYAIETPRLLLNSTSGRFPDGLANSSGHVGTCLMAQAGPVVWGRFEREIRQYKAPPACAISEEFYETDPRNDFARGYSLQTVAPLPIAMAHLVADLDGAFGDELLLQMRDYNHYAAIGVLGEILPNEANQVALHPTAKDHLGLPAPYVHFNLFENDRRMMAAGIARARAVLDAAGATETWAVRRYAHLVGSCRMGFTPDDSVVDGWCRTWDVPNLFVCDGSVLPTQGSANPGLTISALAARTADWIRRAASDGSLATRTKRDGVDAY